MNAAASLGSAAAKKRATLSQMREASKRLQSAAAKAKVTSKKRIISDREATDEANAELQAFKVRAAAATAASLQLHVCDAPAVDSSICLSARAEHD